SEVEPVRARTGEPGGCGDAPQRRSRARLPRGLDGTPGPPVAHAARPESGDRRHATMTEVVIGTLGSSWRATVTETGSVVAETGARFVVPDAALLEAVVAARCDALLTVPGPGDRVGRVLAVAERVRLGEAAVPWVDDVAATASAVARAASRSDAAWDDIAA